MKEGRTEGGGEGVNAKLSDESIDGMAGKCGVNARNVNGNNLDGTALSQYIMIHRYKWRK